MVQVTEKELTEDTQRYLSLLETQSGKVIFFGMLKDLFGWKGFYPGNERLGDGALVTLRNSLRLVSSRQDRSLEKYSMASIPIFADYLVELLKSTDGYFGRGLNTVRCSLHMESTQGLCSRIRESESLDPFTLENMGWVKVYPYLNHPLFGALILEVRHEMKGFGLFLFRGESHMAIHTEEIRKALS